MFGALSFLCPLQAQQPPQPAGETAQSQTGKADSDPPEIQTSPNNDRLFWTLPNFLTVENAKDVPPLTAGQKFKLIARSSFDPVEYPYIGLLASISQIENSEPAFGQGAKGYAKRYGSAFADNAIANFMTGAVMPSLFRQDPRYYQLGSGSVAHRALYAISRIFVIRSDSGHSRFNISEIGGNALAAGIANLYHPAQDRSAANSVSIWWTQIGWDTLSNEAKEFWPDIHRKLHKNTRSPS
ncbi:MAG TPA: hypothetical protein VLX58_01870 [Bryobacteraceae bacterium]|nr:hypothetical protein [Bryobacteraceae bacterium]